MPIKTKFAVNIIDIIIEFFYQLVYSGIVELFL